MVAGGAAVVVDAAEVEEPAEATVTGGGAGAGAGVVVAAVVWAAGWAAGWACPASGLGESL
jgi:hypothetical protein